MTIIPFHEQRRERSAKRLIDILIVIAAFTVLAVPICMVALLIRLTSPGPAIYWSKRIGRNNRIFLMPKFRTMHMGAPELATHLLVDSKRWITPIGHYLRKTSFDELPQLWSILRGDMSFVGPRPALFNQYDLVGRRTTLGVHRLVPGLTGLAQINGRDELTNSKKVAYDAYYLRYQSILFDLLIIVLTAVKVVRRDGIQQVDEFSEWRSDDKSMNRKAA